MVEIVDDIWQKAQEFMHSAGMYMGVGHIEKTDDLYLFEKRLEPKVSAWNFFISIKKTIVFHNISTLQFHKNDALIP